MRNLLIFPALALFAMALSGCCGWQHNACQPACDNCSSQVPGETYLEDPYIPGTTVAPGPDGYQPAP